MKNRRRGTGVRHYIFNIRVGPFGESYWYLEIILYLYLHETCRILLVALFFFYEKKITQLNEDSPP